MRVENSDMSLKDYEGKVVRLTFLDGKSMSGRLLQEKNYELYIQIEKDQKIVAVFKHALKYLIEVEG